MRRDNPKRVLAQAGADHRKIWELLDNSFRQLSRRLALHVLVGDDNHRGLRFQQALRQVLLAQTPRTDHFDCRFRAQNPLHAFAKEVLGTDQQNARFCHTDIRFAQHMPLGYWN